MVHRRQSCGRRATALLLLILNSVGVTFCSVSAYQLDRRTWWRKVIVASSTITAATTAASTGSHSSSAWASQYCVSGVGEECEALAEGNDFIRTLQQKSAENRERYNQEALNAYNMKNYPDYFASIGKTMLKKSDGSGYVLVSDAELTKLLQSNQITLEIPTTMGGKVRDVTQKPIMVLKNVKSQQQQQQQQE